MPFRLRKPLTLPVTLDRHQVYIFPTRHGLVFILILLAMLAGSINYNNNLGFLLVFLLGGIVIVSMLHTYYNILGLQVLSLSAESVFAGDNAEFHFFFNPGPHVRRAVSVSAEKNQSRPSDLYAMVDRPVSVMVPAPHRGILLPESFVISTIYPLGLFCAWAIFRSEKGSVVYPFPLAGPMFGREYDSGKKDRQYGKISGTDDFKGLKSYQPGDSFRHISWKTLSRGQGAFIKEFAGERGKADLVFDLTTVMRNDTETGLSRLCDMILQADRQHLRYGLVLPGKTIVPDSGRDHRQRCLTALATYEQDVSDG